MRKESLGPLVFIQGLSSLLSTSTYIDLRNYKVFTHVYHLPIVIVLLLLGIMLPLVFWGGKKYKRHTETCRNRPCKTSRSSLYSKLIEALDRSSRQQVSASFFQQRSLNYMFWVNQTIQMCGKLEGFPLYYSSAMFGLVI